MSASVFPHPILAPLFGDEEIASYFTAAADIEAMVAFEVALAEAECRSGLIEAAQRDQIRACAAAFAPPSPQRARPRERAR